MKRLCAIVIIFQMCFIGCDSTKELSDEKINELIVGTWAELVDSEDRIMVYTTYFSDGRFHSYGHLEENFKNYVSIDGTWKVDDGISCITIGFISNHFFDEGHKTCSRVIAIDSKKFVFEQNGYSSTMKRITTGKL